MATAQTIAAFTMDHVITQDHSLVGDSQLWTIKIRVQLIVRGLRNMY